MTNIIGLIPARGGSKGVKRKNIKSLCGKPLIYYSISEAKKSKFLTRIITSTEDDEIAEVAKKYGSEVIKRPMEFATDNAPMLGVMEHVVTHLKKQENFQTDVLVLIPPTCPLRLANDIDSAIELFLKSDCDSVMAVFEAEHPPYWSLVEEGKYLQPAFPKEKYYARRQDLPKAYFDGPIYIMKPEKLFENKGFLGKKTIAHIMPKERGLDIDTEFDFELAEFYMKKRQK